MSMKILWKTTRSVRKKVFMYVHMYACPHGFVCWSALVHTVCVGECTRLHDQAIQATLNEPRTHLHSSNSHSLSNPCEWTTVIINILIFTNKEPALATGWFSVPSKMKTPNLFQFAHHFRLKMRVCRCRFRWSIYPEPGQITLGLTDLRL